MDILLWLVGRRCERVASYGSLRHLDAAHAPKGAPARCLDGCPASGSCRLPRAAHLFNRKRGLAHGHATTDLSCEGQGKGAAGRDRTAGVCTGATTTWWTGRW